MLLSIRIKHSNFEVILIKKGSNKRKFSIFYWKKVQYSLNASIENGSVVTNLDFKSNFKRVYNKNEFWWLIRECQRHLSPISLSLHKTKSNHWLRSKNIRKTQISVSTQDFAFPINLSTHSQISWQSNRHEKKVFIDQNTTFSYSQIMICLTITCTLYEHYISESRFPAKKTKLSRTNKQQHCRIVQIKTRESIWARVKSFFFCFFDNLINTKRFSFLYFFCFIFFVWNEKITIIFIWKQLCRIQYKNLIFWMKKSHKKCIHDYWICKLHKIFFVNILDFMNLKSSSMSNFWWIFFPVSYYIFVMCFISILL